MRSDRETGSWQSLSCATATAQIGWFPMESDDAAEIWVVQLVLAVIVAPFAAWLIMLSLGSLHEQWYSVPAFGYGTTYLIVTALVLFSRIMR